ncbi:MAG: YbhB/YbcL family Raf kinase inhibitor-like protein, partial [Parafilimonas terrae]|nr:YbhB/YbcL family Raf kinase inhibitor-like protein [Parafilimonas terrae]
KAGRQKTAYQTAFSAIPETLALTSPAFADGADLPARFTADGGGVSPPLAWSGLPDGTAALVLLVEDAGSPTPEPLVHLIVWDLPADPATIREGDLPSPGRPGGGRRLGRNSFLRSEWLPPDPPSGHGRHDYVFQLYALRQALDLGRDPGRSALLEAMRDHVIAKGQLTGAYARL